MWGSMDTLVIFTLGLVRSGSEVIEVPPPCVFHRVDPRVLSEFSRYRSADALSAHCHTL